MKVIIESPIVMRLIFDSDLELENVQKTLTYKNRSVEYRIKQLQNKKYVASYYGHILEELHQKLYNSLLFSDNKGYYTRVGLLPFLKKRYKVEVIENNIQYPEFKLLPWHNQPTMTPHLAQARAIDALLNNPHSHIEMATGTGKSFIIMHLIKKTGLPTVVSTPNVSIAEQLYEQACHLFGKNLVGFYGGSKKQVGKHILICVGKSLGLTTDPEAIQEFQKYQVLISDESHTLPAETFESFCHNLLGHCPYRWFVSGTQQRTAGDDLLLYSIIGERVYSYSIQQAINDKVLAKLSFKIFNVFSNSNYFNDKNVVKMNQHHFYKNETIAKIIAQITRAACEKNKPVLILIDEYMQEEILKKYMSVEYVFANAQTDNFEIVKKFNAGEIFCVVGTSAVSVGTDFKPVQVTINWQANRSPIKIKQGAIGRSTRVDANSGKFECTVVDFCVTNIPIIKRHCQARISYYRDIGDVEFIDANE